MLIRFVFHNPIGERGVGKLIVGYTWLLGLFYNWKVLKYNFSHMELWIPDENGNFYNGQCFSSTTRGDWNGVRFAPASEVLKHPERWSYIEGEVENFRCEVAIEEARKLVGKAYDYGYILSFLQPFIVQKEKAWACSEICDWFAYLCRIFPKKHRRISPRRFAYILSRIWGELKQLVWGSFAQNGEKLG